MLGKCALQSFQFDVNLNFFFAFLLNSYLMDLVTKCGIDLKFGIVQTAYANGGSTDYIQKELVWQHLDVNLYQENL